jgi:hypothetical protein
MDPSSCDLLECSTRTVPTYIRLFVFICCIFTAEACGGISEDAQKGVDSDGGGLADAGEQMGRFVLVTDPGPFQPACYDGSMLGCTGEIEMHRLDSGSLGDPELHIISVYQTHEPPEWRGCEPQGIFRAHVTRPGRHVLFLNALGSVHWQVSAGADAEIMSVVVVGYSRATLEAPPSAVTRITTFEIDGIYETQIATSTTGFEARELMAYAQDETGTALATFHAAYCQNAALVD